MAEVSSLDAWNLRLLESDRKFYMDLNEIRAIRNMPPIAPSYEWMKIKPEPEINPELVISDFKSNRPWRESFQDFRESFEKMKEAAEQLRATFGQMADEMKKLREESEASEQEAGSCEDCVVPLKENTDQLAVNMQKDSNAHYVFDEMPKMEIGWNHLGEGVNPNLEVKPNLGASLVNYEGIAMIDDMARKMVLVNMNRDSTNMNFSLRSSLKGNSPFSLLEFHLMDGSCFLKIQDDAHTVMSELMANSFHTIGIGMNNFRKISVSPLEQFTQLPYNFL